MKIKSLVFLLIFMPIVAWAESKSETEITMTTTQAMQLAGALVDWGDFRYATQILTPPKKTEDFIPRYEKF